MVDDADLAAVSRSCSYLHFAMLRIWELAALALASELPSTYSSVAGIFTAEHMSVRWDRAFKGADNLLRRNTSRRPKPHPTSCPLGAASKDKGRQSS